MAVSLKVNVPCAEPALDETKVGLFVKAIAPPFPSVKVSTIDALVKTRLPLFLTKIV